MTKIVFVLPDMPGGGTERVVALLANEYVKRGYPVTILLFAGDQTAYPLNENIEVYITGRASKGKLSIRMQRLCQMRKFYKNNPGCYIFAFSVMGAVFSVITAAGIPHRMLVSERSDPTRFKQWRIRNWAYGKAEKLIIQTEEIKQYFPEKLREKSAVVPNPVADDLPEPFPGERKKRIVSVGRLEAVKNYKLLIAAFADFASRFAEYELHMFGIGELEGELKKQVQELGLADKVVFRGFSSNIKEDICDSGMFVLSSDYEGISNSMIEALAMGIPVIATDCPVGGSRMYIQNGVNGILISVGDREGLVSAMEKIAMDSEFAKKISYNGVRIKEKYGLAQIADKLLEEAGIE